MRTGRWHANPGLWPDKYDPVKSYPCRFGSAGQRPDLYQPGPKAQVSTPPQIFEGWMPDPLGIGPRTKWWREIETWASCSPTKFNPSNQGKWFQSVQRICEQLQTPLLKSQNRRSISSNLVETTGRLELDILPIPRKNHNQGPKTGQRIVKNHSNCVTWVKADGNRLPHFTSFVENPNHFTSCAMRTDPVPVP